MNLNLAGKTAIITGGSRGIGRCIALRLAEEGCHLAICGRSPEHLRTTAAELAGRGVSVVTSVTDVSEAGAVERFVGEAALSLGAVDLLVANVGGSVGAGLLETTLEEWKRTFELNLFHAVGATRAVVPHMKKRSGGSVLIISSISGWKPVNGRAQYATAKAAEIHLAHSLARELAPYRIRVNALSPGSVLFDGGAWAQFRDREPEAFAKFEREELPWGRLATPLEIADVAVFLLSDRARWINGANIPADGAQRSPSAW